MSMRMVVYSFKDHRPFCTALQKPVEIRGMPGMRFSLSLGTPTLILVKPSES